MNDKKIDWEEIEELVSKIESKIDDFNVALDWLDTEMYPNNETLNKMLNNLRSRVCTVVGEKEYIQYEFEELKNEMLSQLQHQEDDEVSEQTIESEIEQVSETDHANCVSTEPTRGMIRMCQCLPITLSEWKKRILERQLPNTDLEELIKEREILKETTAPIISDEVTLIRELNKYIGFHNWIRERNNDTVNFPILGDDKIKQARMTVDLKNGMFYYRHNVGVNSITGNLTKMMSDSMKNVMMYLDLHQIPYQVKPEDVLNGTHSDVVVLDPVFVSRNCYDEYELISMSEDSMTFYGSPDIVHVMECFNDVMYIATHDSIREITQNDNEFYIADQDEKQIVNNILIWSHFEWENDEATQYIFRVLKK